MPLDTKFARFVRSGGRSEFTLRLHQRPARRGRPVFARKSEFPDIDVYVEAFRTDLAAVDQDNRLFLAAHLQDVFRSTPGEFELADMTEEREQTVSEYRATLTGLQTLLIRGRDGIDADIQTAFEEQQQSLRAWLLRRFAATASEARQRALGITHYIWRTRDDAKVRSSHADRDDLVYAWDHRHDDGPPGHPFGCRCWAEPAIAGGRILGARDAIASGLADRVRSARAAGFKEALRDVAVDGVEAAIDSVGFLVRAAELGFKERLGTITPGEQVELDGMRRLVREGLEQLSELDRETIKALLEEVDKSYRATVAHRRAMDLSFRLGLTSEQRLLDAHRDESHLQATLAVGGLTAGAGLASALRGLRTGFKALGPAALLRKLRDRRERLERDTEARRVVQARIVGERFDELASQGHGPQRHEGAVTRQMLEDRALRGIDPITGTSIDGVTGGRHFAPRVATRIKIEADFVAAEAHIRRSRAYRDAWDAAINAPDADRRNFEVMIRIDDALGPDFRDKVEGVRRVGSPKNSQGVDVVDFTGGRVRARFEILPDGEPRLITLYPQGVSR